MRVALLEPRRRDAQEPRAGPQFVDLCLSHRDELLELLATEQVNTNEVGRSAVLGPALTLIASRYGATLTAG